MDDAPLAGLFSRVIASVMDGVLIFSTLLPGVLLMFAFGGPDVIEQQYPAVQVLIVLITMVLFFGVGIGQIVLLTIRGQSVGKIALGIKIVRTDGSEPGFIYAVLLRAWLPNFFIGIANYCCMGWLILLIDVLPALGEERLCLHDRLADTKVVVA